MLVRKAIAAASVTALMTAGLGFAAAAPASAAPTLVTQITQDLGGQLRLLRNVNQLVINLPDGGVINVDVNNLTVVALNNILNNLTVTIQNIDVNIVGNTVIVDVL